MTLNQVITRIKSIALAQRLIKNAFYGSYTDYLNEHQVLYASLIIQDNGAPIDVTGKVSTFNFRLFFLDLVHVSEDTKSNEQDVLSDMYSVVQDTIAKINHSSYTDWKVDGLSNVVFVRESDDDMTAGCVMDISISTPYVQDICAIPENEVPTDELVYWSFFYTDPYGDIENENFLFNMGISENTQSYSLDFTVNGNQTFLAVKELASQPEKTSWVNTQLNYGVFPDQVFRAPVIIMGYRYYVSRKPVVLQDINTNIIFSV